MNIKTKFFCWHGQVFAFVFLLLLFQQTALSQVTALTYQGKLTDNGNPANGSYDLQFALFDNLTGGTQIGSTLTHAGTNVAAGIFTVQLDFGVSAFPGASRFLEIGVRPASTGSFTILSPRQRISSTPYAIRTVSAATADTATNSTQLGGVAASQYVQTNDSRLSDSRAPTPGSANYIQNGTTAQSANFNIGGNGTVGGNLGIGTNNPTSRVEIADRNGLAITGVEPFLTLRDTASNGKRSIISAENGNFSFHPESFIGGVPAVIIKDSGKVGIGTSGPSSRLSVGASDCNSADIFWGKPGGACGNVLSVSTDGSAINLIHGFGPFGTVMQVRPDGSVLTNGSMGVGTLSPARLFHVNGRARVGSIPLEISAATVCFNSSGDLLQCGMSSLRFKTNVARFTNGLDIVRRLKPISFDWKDGSGHDIGLGAEDVAKVDPSFTFIDKKGEVAGVKYERLNILLINAVKEQQKQIERLSARLRVLEKNRRRRAAIR